MLRTLSAPSIVPAINGSARAGSGKTVTDRTGSDGNEWFKRAARDLLGSDPGLALHVLTGIPERSGYRYASGERAVPTHILRLLLRGPQGRQWLAAIMDGYGGWYAEIERDGVQAEIGRTAARKTLTVP